MTDVTIRWTINLQCDQAQTEEVQALLEQFLKQAQAVGASCNYSQVMPMEAKAVPASQMMGLENMANMMRQQGMPEAQIERQQLLIAAQMGQGSWEAVMEAAERELAAQRAANNVMQEASSLLGLIEYAMNARQKEKAAAYFEQAEQVILSQSWADSLQAETPDLASGAHEQVKQMYVQQLERLRNWLF